MAQIAPVAPKSFYEGGLGGLKTILSDPSLGMITLISAVPDDIESCWSEVGAGIDAGAVGSLVLGKHLIAGISDVVAGDVEGGSTETGWKLVFDAISDVNADLGGNAVAIALLVNRATLGAGTDTDVRYIVDMVDLLLIQGTKYNIPSFDVEIAYGENR